MLKEEEDVTSNQQEGSKRGHDRGEETVKRPRAKRPVIASECQQVEPEMKSSSQWILCREPAGASKETNTMVLMDHLGDTSAMVESLTHQLDSWSLISQPKKEQTTQARNENRKRAKDSKRAIMKTLLSKKEGVSEACGVE
jgi:hypothetical protein